MTYLSDRPFAIIIENSTYRIHIVVPAHFEARSILINHFTITVLSVGSVLDVQRKQQVSVKIIIDYYVIIELTLR